MAESIKQISAPVLASDYGSNIEKTFKNIDDNFKVLGNSDLWKGDQGNGLIVGCISWANLLLANPTITIPWGIGGDNRTYKFDNPESKIRAAFTAMDSSASATDLTDIINQLKASNDEIVIELIQTDDIDGGIYPGKIIAVHPTVILDARFIHALPNNIPSLEGKTDMSCSIYCSGENWTATHSFPTLYYNADLGYLTWRIYNTDTQLPAQGPAGAPGLNSYSWVVKLQDDFTSQGMYNISHFMSNNNSGWVPANEFAGVGGVLPKTGDVCIVIPNDNPNAQGYKYWISSLYKTSADTPSYKTYCGNDNWRWAYLTEDAFNYVMSQISPTGVNKGYSIPISDSEGYYVVGESTHNHELVISPSNTFNSVPSYPQAGEIISDANARRTIITGGSLASEWYDAEEEGSGYYRGVNTASGLGSHAEGYGTISQGSHSHAEGRETTSKGYYSHTEGQGTTASGFCSHAEGQGTTASGDCAHAEGQGTAASGFCSHAEGYNAIASGDYSHAGGGYVDNTLRSHNGGQSKGLGSFAFGELVETSPATPNEISFGQYNETGNLWVAYYRFSPGVSTNRNVTCGIILPKSSTVHQPSPTDYGIDPPAGSSGWSRIGYVVFSIGGGTSEQRRNLMFVINKSTEVVGFENQIIWVWTGHDYNNPDNQGVYHPQYKSVYSDDFISQTS